MFFTFDYIHILYYVFKCFSNLVLGFDNHLYHLVHDQVGDVLLVDPISHHSCNKEEDDAPVTPVKEGHDKEGEEGRDQLPAEGDDGAL